MIRFKYNGPTSEQEKEGKSSKHGDILSNSGQESKAYSLHASKGRFGTSSNFSFQTEPYMETNSVMVYTLMRLRLQRKLKTKTSKITICELQLNQNKHNKNELMQS
jgi:hypothetical protein